MADHVGYEIASPKIEESKHGAEHQRDDDIGPAAGPMRNTKDEERNNARPKAIQTERFQAFNGVAAVEQFSSTPARRTIRVISQSGSFAKAAPDEPPL
jgi:hypothetical protein